MLLIGVGFGFVLFWLTVWINRVVINSIRRMPPREASKRIFIQYAAKMALFILILSVITWKAGFQVSLGILIGMFLGNAVFLLVNRKKRVLPETVNDAEKQN
jgi:hypothetical protein